jgi:periplasmic divalent cation tolerance protein
MESAVRAVLVTVPDMEVAERLATRLVQTRAAACVNLVPGITSIYRWEGNVERADEVLLILKTSDERLPDLLARTAELHPYDVPEILALEVPEGHGPYLAWVARETSSSADPSDAPSPPVGRDRE